MTASPLDPTSHDLADTALDQEQQAGQNTLAYAQLPAADPDAPPPVLDLEALTHHQVDLKRDLPGIIQNVTRNLDLLNTSLVGFDAVLRQTVYALLARDHLLIFSRAGIAKSMYAQSVFGMFDNSRVFKYQFTKGTPEEGVFGALDIEKLKAGVVWHNTQGSLVDSHFAFLDELFDANDVVLRAMLSVLNERVLSKGKQQENSPLHTAIATSNYIRNSELTEALLDRFPFRAVMHPPSDPYDRLRVDLSYEKNMGKAVVTPAERRVPFEHIHLLADLVEGRYPDFRVQVPRHVLFLKNVLIESFETEFNKMRQVESKPPIYISPRSYAKMIDLLVTSTLLRGQQRTATQDLTSLVYATTEINNRQQANIFDDCVRKLRNNFCDADCKTVDQIMLLHDLFENLIDGRQTPGQFPPGLLQRLCIALHITKPQQVTADNFIAHVGAIPSKNADVVKLRDGLVNRIKRNAHLLGAVTTAS